MFCLCLSCGVAVHSYTQAGRGMKREENLKGDCFSLNIEHSVCRFYLVLIYILGKIKKSPYNIGYTGIFKAWLRR